MFDFNIFSTTKKKKQPEIILYNFVCYRTLNIEYMVQILPILYAICKIHMQCFNDITPIVFVQPKCIINIQQESKS